MKHHLSKMTDRELVEIIRDYPQKTSIYGVCIAYKAFRQRHYDRLIMISLRCLAGLKDREIMADAQDLVQDVFEEVYCKRQEYLYKVSSDSWNQWLNKMVRNQSLSFKSKQGKRYQIETENKDAIAYNNGLVSGISADSEIYNGVTQNQFYQAISELDNEEWKKIILKELEGYSIKEIALIIGKTEQQIYKQREKARAKLNEFLSR